MRIRGITVDLVKKTKIGENPFGASVYDESTVRVSNVLVAPASADDVVNSLNLYGKKAVYILGIPKGDTNQWEDTEVRFFGQSFRTFGKLTQGIEEMMPLAWNKKIRVEVLE